MVNRGQLANKNFLNCFLFPPGVQRSPATMSQKPQLQKSRTGFVLNLFSPNQPCGRQQQMQENNGGGVIKRSRSFGMASSSSNQKTSQRGSPASFTSIHSSYSDFQISKWPKIVQETVTAAVTGFALFVVVSCHNYSAAIWMIMHLFQPWTGSLLDNKLRWWTWYLMRCWDMMRSFLQMRRSRCPRLQKTRSSKLWRKWMDKKIINLHNRAVVLTHQNSWRINPYRLKTMMGQTWALLQFTSFFILYKYVTHLFKYWENY